ncbi:hypothetical protein [Mycobacterium neumannii]
MGTCGPELRITHRLPLTEADQAIELLSGEANKILFLSSMS